MAKKWLLLAGLMWLAVPVCCEAVGQIGQAGLHGPSGLDVPVGPNGENATVGEPAGVGLGIAEQVRAGMGPENSLGAAVGMPQRIRERWMNREAPAASDPPEQSETPDSEEGDPDVGTAGEEAPNLTRRPSFISNLVDSGLLSEDQVGDMRTAGAGWGAIRISGLLADRVAADTADSEDALTFEDALDSVLGARAEGMGFGAIALMHDLKLGHVLANAK